MQKSIIRIGMELRHCLLQHSKATSNKPFCARILLDFIDANIYVSVGYKPKNK